MAKNAAEPGATRRRRIGGLSIALALGLAVLFATGPAPDGSPDAHEIAGAMLAVETAPLLARLPTNARPVERQAPAEDAVPAGYLSAPVAAVPEEAVESLFAGGFLSAPLRRSEAALERWLLAAATDEPALGFRPAPLDRLVGQPSEIECLALNIYFEARGESLKGRQAVGNVTMNRVLDPGFPDTVCGVVRQGALSGKKRRGCQFSWWCDGRSDRPVDQRAWADSHDLALSVYWDRSRDPTDGALWFHADYVSPDWAEVFDRGPQIGRHLFYRRPGPELPAPVEAAPIIEVEAVESLEPEPTRPPWTL